MSESYRKGVQNVLNEIAAEAQARQELRESTRTKSAIQSYDDIRDLKEHYAFVKEQKIKYHNTVLTEMLETALNAVYISALQKEHVLSESDLRLAEKLVSNLIQEKGGAKAMLRSMDNTTFFNNTIVRLVEDAAEEAEAEADEEQQDFEEVPDESKEEMLDKMEKDESVDDAVEMIASRIANAEEEFIQKNKEDKEKIESIVADINQRIEAVKADPTTDEEVKTEEEEQLNQEMAYKIRSLDQRRSTPIYEHMMKSIASYIIKDKDLREVYCAENGKVQIDRAITTGTVIYGFLEFVNTTKLVKVDEAYVEKIVKEFK